MEDLAKIKERITKLLAMSKDTSSPEEAAIAAQRARKLMDKHQIDESALVTGKGVEYVFVDRPHGKSYKYMGEWISVIAVAVAKYNDCQAMRCAYRGDKPGYSRVGFRGTQQDVEITCQMFDYLLDVGLKLTKEYMNGLNKASISDAFKRGYSHEIANRLAAMTVARREELQTEETGLMVIDNKLAAVEKHFGEIKYGTTKGGNFNWENEEHTDAFAHGKWQAKQVQINPVVE